MSGINPCVDFISLVLRVLSFQGYGTVLGWTVCSLHFLTSAVSSHVPHLYLWLSPRRCVNHSAFLKGGLPETLSLPSRSQREKAEKQPFLLCLLSKVSNKHFFLFGYESDFSLLPLICLTCSVGKPCSEL